VLSDRGPRERWATRGDGGPAPSGQPPERLPPGPLRVSCIIFRDLRFAILSRMA
jgi:hypothetical protein